MSREKPDLVGEFQRIILRILAGEPYGLFLPDLGGFLELISWNLAGQVESRRNQYFDGPGDLTVLRMSRCKVRFTGEMWVGKDSQQWTEPFWCTVVDKRITKQGFWIQVQVGEDRGEGESVQALRRYGE